MTENTRPISIAMLALGGQGGGVLTKWLVDLAESQQYLAQSTYIAGVAQRTGATLYCVEMFPESAANQAPVFTPVPIPGDVDLVIAGEMAETGRAIMKGFVSPGVTTLIASSHRVYTIDEKSAMGDGIVDQGKVAEIAAKAARQFIAFDMDEIATRTNCVISAILFGAIAGSGALPFERSAFEETIRKSGRAVAENLAGFTAGFKEAAAGQVRGVSSGKVGDEIPPIEANGPAGAALADRVAAELPKIVRNAALHGALKALDYQDVDYANEYLDRVAEMCELETGNLASDAHCEVSAEVARQLALQMCYEDTARVADLKIRGERFARIRVQVNAAPNQPLQVVEYFHPRIEEICDMLPAALGKRIMESNGIRRVLSPLFSKGRNVNTTSVSGFLLLKTIAGMRRFRRASYRYSRQHKFIASWLDHVRIAIVSGKGAALAIARSIEIVKGYGDTYERGLSRFESIMQSVGAADVNGTAERVTRLHNAALADEEGKVFAETLADIGVSQ